MREPKVDRTAYWDVFRGSHWEEDGLKENLRILLDNSSELIRSDGHVEQSEVTIGNLNPHGDTLAARRFYLANGGENHGLSFYQSNIGSQTLLPESTKVPGMDQVMMILSASDVGGSQRMNPAPKMWFKLPLLAIHMRENTTNLDNVLHRMDEHGVWEADVIVYLNAIAKYPTDKNAFGGGPMKSVRLESIGVQTWLMATIVRNQTDRDGLFLLRTPDGSDLGFIEDSGHLRRDILTEYWHLLATEGRARSDENDMYELARLFHQRYFSIEDAEFRRLLVNQARVEASVPQL